MVTQNKLLLISLSLCLLSGCTTQNFLGKYYNIYNKTTPNHLELTLSDNGHFKYNIHTDVLGSDIVYGIWKKSGNKLILTYDDEAQINLKDDYIEEINNSDTDLSLKTIRIDLNNGVSLMDAEVQINSKPNKYITNDLGVVKIKIDSIKTISINFPLLSKSRKFKIKNPKSSSIRITLYEHELVPYIYDLMYKNWKIKNRKLIPTDKEGKTLKDGYFVKGGQ